MSFTAKQVIDDARPLTNDKDKTTWSDSDFLKYLNEVVRILYAEHPECRLDDDGALTVYADTAINGNVPLDDIYKPALVEYLAYRFHDADAGDTRDKARAAEHLQRFNDLIGPSK
jgi:hypothetical protein